MQRTNLTFVRFVQFLRQFRFSQDRSVYTLEEHISVLMSYKTRKFSMWWNLTKYQETRLYSMQYTWGTSRYAKIQRWSPSSGYEDVKREYGYTSSHSYHSQRREVNGLLHNLAALAPGINLSYLYLLTPWSTVLIEKLIGSQSRNSPHFMEPKVHYRIYKCPPPGPVRNQIKPVIDPTIPLP